MKLRIRKSTPYISLCLAVLSFFVVSALVFASLGRSAQAQVESGKLITVHDRGVESSFISNKETLREAFADNKIDIDARDAVEPALDEKLVASDYQVNIYRARPVTVIDGATRQRIVTPYQTAEQIVKDAGITLNPEDTTKMTRSTDIVVDGAGLQLSIDRATPLVLDLYGTKTDIRTQATTVGEMLKEKNIDLGDSGRASLSFDTPITNGMELRVWREGKQTVTTEELVPFEVEQVKDADRAASYKQVQTEGKNGKNSVTYEVTIQNGVEVSRTKIASVQIEAATKQVEIIGSKPEFLPYSGGGSKTDWLAASNIPGDSWGYADYMVSRESGWNPNALNASSGACGLAQALPCSKLGPNWNDPVVALNWMNGYAVGRYGSWQAAYNFWQKNHWY